jgi:predicted Fe-Mo cluster-binding NifX family protein
VVLKLKIAICTESGNVAQHFGRAPEFIFVTIEDGKVIEKKSLSNPGHTVGSIPEFINGQGATCMITGGIGHRAIGFFNQYGIEVIRGVIGSVDDTIGKILDGTLEGGENICSPGVGKGYGVEKIHTEADDNYRNHHHH